MGLTVRCGDVVNHYTNTDLDNLGREVLTRLIEGIDNTRIQLKKEAKIMEMTAFELEDLAAERLNEEFWGIIENNGMLEIPTNRETNVQVRKAPRHPGYYLVAAV